MSLRARWDWLASLPARLGMIGPIVRLSWRHKDEKDYWRSLEHPVPLMMFGAGCRNDFTWYLDGESHVTPNSLADICRWLSGCTYVDDWTLFRTDDFWQHPATFEQIRKGDCEDHALWAWRNLRRLGFDTEFMVGECLAGATAGQHAWVVFQNGQGQFLLESVAGDPQQMILPLRQARPLYRPHFGVDHRLTRKIYGGFVGGPTSGRSSSKQSACTAV